ncbi:MAG TPA: hypothetical protein VNE41_07465 [Chitinophagaceae bacterium]|nr:hypothetical protein [Chitinophagaceae bacterium]
MTLAAGFLSTFVILGVPEFFWVCSLTGDFFSGDFVKIFFTGNFLTTGFTAVFLIPCLTPEDFLATDFLTAGDLKATRFFIAA